MAAPAFSRGCAYEDLDVLEAAACMFDMTSESDFQEDLQVRDCVGSVEDRKYHADKQDSLVQWDPTDQRAFMLTSEGKVMAGKLDKALP